MLQTFVRFWDLLKHLAVKKGLGGGFGPTMGLGLSRFVLQTFVRVLGFVKTSNSKEKFVWRVWANNGFRMK